ncbi:MAG: hypothetical protein IIV81_02735 [Clostridia bacterium]|nr:hypothetical protein [Clostridia bacterium]
MKVRDVFWLWGHPEGAYNPNREEPFGNNHYSRMTPMEGCLYLGIHKTFMVPVGIPINRRQYNKSFKTLSNVGWECFGALTKPDKVNEIINESKEFKNITAAVFDDFKGQANKKKEKGEEVTPDALWGFREKFNAHDIDMWMVFYTNEFGLDEKEDEEFMKFLSPFNGIIMWTWEEKDVPLIPEKFEVFKKMTPDCRRMFGCYLYNFGEKKQATGKAVKWQLDFYLDKIKKGEAEGIVFHTNTMADLDYEAYDAAVEWMDEHGDEEI